MIIWLLCVFTIIHENLNETKQKKRLSVPGVASVVDHPLDCVKALPLVWDVEGFKYMWERGVITTDPGDGSL